MDVALENLSHLNLTGQVEKICSAVQGGGGFYDVYHGKLLHGDRLVAVRELRVYLRERGDFEKKLARELMIWAGLEHGNVLPFLGFSLDFDRCPAFISEWMGNGNVLSYIKQNSGVDKVRLGIASGLNYLHDRGIVHSDMKSDNVLISNDGIPLISDFGLSRLLVSSGIVTSTKELVGSLRWIAIEFFVPEYANLGRDVDVSPVVGASKETDVWAFGMTVSEILTGQVPYYDMKHEAQIIRAIMSGRHPEPITIASSESEYSELSVRDEKLWSICRQCWRLHASTRPTMSEVLEQLSSRKIGDLSFSKIGKKSIQQDARVRVLVSVTVGRVRNPHVLDQDILTSRNSNAHRYRYYPYKRLEKSLYCKALHRCSPGGSYGCSTREGMTGRNLRLFPSGFLNLEKAKMVNTALSEFFALIWNLHAEVKA